MNGKKKKKLAIKVGDTITKDEFETLVSTKKS